MSTESIAIIAAAAAIVIALVGITTLFYKMFSDLKRDMRDMKSDLKGQMGEMKQGLERQISEVKSEMGEMKKDLRHQISEVKSQMGEMKEDLQGQISGVKQDLQHETSRIWKSIDAMSVAHQTLSDRVGTLSDRLNQVIASTGAVVKESRVSYKGGKGATGSKKSG